MKSIMTGNSDLQNDFRGIDLFQNCTFCLFSEAWDTAIMITYVIIKINIKMNLWINIALGDLLKKMGESI